MQHVCSRVLGDELFDFSCLNNTDEFLSSDLLTTPPTCYNAYWSTMNLLIVYMCQIAIRYNTLFMNIYQS